jgi:hypothetical protein
MVGCGANATNAGHNDRHLLGWGSLHQVFKTTQLHRLEVGHGHLTFPRLNDHPGMAFDAAKGKG